MAHKIKIHETSQVTHDVKRFVTERPNGYAFRPGQATNFELLVDDLEGEKRPFSFTCLDDADTLEFIIKIYEEHDGLTEALMTHNPGDEISIEEPFGAIQYQGPGAFIAGGAGITPFISILRRLQADDALEGNSLHFSNKTAKDIILREELSNLLGDGAHFVLSQDQADGCHQGRIDQAYLREHFVDLNQNFYVCGPPPMVENVIRVLHLLGADPKKVITEDGL